MADSQQDGSGGRVRKRRRVIISCTECHRRKQKCDRGLPCENCKSRKKESACVYEDGAPTAKQRQQHSRSTEESRASLEGSTADEIDEPLSKKAADWGYVQNGASTLGFLKHIETATGDSRSTISPSQQPRVDVGVREKYKNLVRQLPAKNYIDRLVAMYFASFNWQYYPIDPEIFQAQLEEWNNTPFALFSTVGPSGLSTEMRAFPALLFQIAATGLLLLPEEPNAEFDSLKYMGNMRFEDLAAEYSESGNAILDVLGKKNLSFVTVQAQFLRASFYKLTAHVTEAWHTISMTIRDAQDLGMHRDSLDPEPDGSSVEAILENQWLIQRRRRMYALLITWDLNCAVVLGRPGTVDWSQHVPTPPIDAPIPQDRSSTPVVPRSGDDPPTPITVVLWIYQLCGPLRAIQNLESENPTPQTFEKVTQIHQSMLDLASRIPPELRLENPDTRFDNNPNLQWLPACRFYIASLHQFSLMALHRPYVFHRKISRTEAVKASLGMLELQKMTFEGLSPDSWKNYLLFFGSFDAIVLIASVYIMFPHEQTELTDSISKHFQWTVERFTAMQDRNPLAKSAQGVLRAIIARFKKVLASHQSAAPTSASNTLTTESGATTLTADSTAVSVSAEDEATQNRNTSITEWMDSSENMAQMAPFFPTGDLVYNDLTTVSDNMGLPDPNMGVDGFPWQFEGDWADNSIWQMLNEY